MEGSPLLVQMESLKESEEELRRIKEGGEIGYMTASELAQAAGKRAGEAQASGYVGAIGSAATGTYKYGKEFNWW
jgi:arginine utilization protein RocB